MTCVVFFFFQAEDGIRDGRVTGVQTCALPISVAWARRSTAPEIAAPASCASVGCASSAPGPLPLPPVMRLTVRRADPLGARAWQGPAHLVMGRGLVYEPGLLALAAPAARCPRGDVCGGPECLDGRADVAAVLGAVRMVVCGDGGRRGVGALAERGLRRGGALGRLVALATCP